METVINTEKYPLNLDPEHETYKRMVDRFRSLYVRDGVVALPQLLRPEVLPDIIKDIQAKLNQVHVTDTMATIYQDKGDLNYAKGHVRNRLFRTKVRDSVQIFYLGHFKISRLLLVLSKN